MAIDQWKLKFYLDSQKDYTSKNFCMFLKSLDSTEIFTNERGVETIAVNEEIYLNFSNGLPDDFTSFELSNIVFHKRVTISNKNNIRITFYNSEARDSFHLSECKGANLAFNGTNIFKANFMVSGSEFENVIINSYLQVDSEMFFIGCVFKDFKVTRYQAPNIEPQFTLEFCHFENKANFMNFVFGDKMRFKQCTFKDNVYFNNSIFKDSADFSQCEFEKTANFYGATFQQAPNFSQAQFKGSLNVVNTNLDFGFESLKEKIKQEHRQQNKNSKKSLVHFANDFRDSYRIFKNALIKDNNLLDASKFHKCELYCKEIELRESVRKRGTKAHDNEGIRKNMKPIKEFIDFLLLRFYRNLCDHHTDFLRCFNNLVLLVALYVGCLLLCSFNFLENKAPSSDILQKIDFVDIFAKFIPECVAMSVKIMILLLLVLCLIVSVWKIFKDILTSIKALLKNVGYFILRLIVPLVVIIIFYVLVATLFKLTPSILLPSFLNITGFFLFFFMYFSLVFLDSAIVRCLIVIIAYMTVSIAIGYKIAILNPLIGKLFTDTLEITDPFLNFITLAYTISMFLVLFSLQKTARKNSIVPN